MNRLIKLLGIILVFFVAFSCTKENDKNLNESSCEKDVIISQSIFDDSLFFANYSIISAEITGDCFEIKFGSSGCDASNWDYDLIDSGTILYSYPPGRNLKLKLDNNEVCTAYFTKEVSFDLTPIQIDGYNSINLFLTGLDTVFVYQYLY